jgi:hypothetical protein
MFGRYVAPGVTAIREREVHAGLRRRFVAFTSIAPSVSVRGGEGVVGPAPATAFVPAFAGIARRTSVWRVEGAMAPNSSMAFVAAKFVTPDNCLFAPIWDLGEVCALMSLILWVHAAPAGPTTILLSFFGFLSAFGSLSQ